MCKLGPEQARVGGGHEGNCPPKELSEVTRDPVTVSRPALVKTRPFRIAAVPLNLLADSRQMAQWRVGVGNKEAGQAPQQGAWDFRGAKRAEWAGHVLSWSAVVMGWGTGCGAQAFMGTWAPLSGGRQ